MTKALRYLDERGRVAGLGKIVLAALILCGGGGCATVPLADPELDQAAKTFHPLPDHGQLYVVRKFGAGGAVLFTTVVDGIIIGSLALKTYVMVPVSPGTHTVVLMSEGTQAVHTLTVEAGRQYFLEAVPYFMRVGLVPLDNAAGQAAVQAASRAHGMVQ